MKLMSCLRATKDVRSSRKKLTSLIGRKKKTSKDTVPERRLSTYERRERIYALMELDRQMIREQKLKEAEIIRKAVEQLMEFERQLNRRR
uniref:BHLH domain-containing protein n=1 Tax=Steinernema glaseri TaxID=37863 RepID=A0A1I7ZMZ5_9BILA